MSQNNTGMVKVIGIDPAPGKGSHVFDEDGIRHLDHSSLKSFLDKLRKNTDKCLVCWDAPLTGPHSPDTEVIKKQDFTQRVIESFFKDQTTGFKSSEGISVQGYARCPHWTISKYMLGLPRIGKYDKQLPKLPFRLITENKPALYPTVKDFVVEVHPAVSIWLWCKHLGEKDFVSWEYKKDKKILEKVWRTLKEILVEYNIVTLDDFKINDFNPKTDDELDAYVAWLLGELWIQNEDKVIMLGSSETGAFLVPNLPALIESWRTFTS